MTTHSLYPSWIEIPAADMERATAFYRAVFGLTETPCYSEPPMQIVVLLPSEKSVRGPGVSLVQSPAHVPGPGGVQVNFHLDSHAALTQALAVAQTNGGVATAPIVDMGDGVRYVTLRDSEGNSIALSAYEPATAPELGHQ